MRDGLAVYAVGSPQGAATLVFPYPHASTLRPMGEDRLTEVLAGIGRRVITFDPPGAYRSTRTMRADLAEMLTCGEEALSVSGAGTPVDVVGHSMGALCALAFAVERPEMVRRLVLIGGCSGFPAVRRWSVPHNWSMWHDRQWWQAIWWGSRQMTATGSLAVHKRLDNLIDAASYVDTSFATSRLVERGDWRRPPPPRARWLRSVRAIDYAERLGEVRAPTLILVGGHDPQTPLPCSRELAAGIPDSTMHVFERSGHNPFVEEPEAFVDTVRGFLSAG